MRMKSVALVLLLSLSSSLCCEAVSVLQQGDSIQESLDLPVLWDQLQGLKELLLNLRAEDVEQRQVLRSLESRLRDREVEAEQRNQQGAVLGRQREELNQQRQELNQERVQLSKQVSELSKGLEEQREAAAWEISVLHLRLNASEGAVDELRSKSTALSAELPFLQTRLRASERTVEQLRRENAVLLVRLCRVETRMDQLGGHTSVSNSSSAEVQSSAEQQETNYEGSMSELLERLKDSERQLGELQNQSSEMLSRLGLNEENLDQLKSQQSELDVRVTVGEKNVEDLKTQHKDGDTQLLAVILKVNQTVEQLDQFTTQNQVMEAELDSLSDRWTASERSSQEMEVRVRVGEKVLGDLMIKQTDAEANLMAVILRLDQTMEQLHQLSMQNQVMGVKVDSLSDRVTSVQRGSEAIQATVMELKGKNQELEAIVRVGEKHLEDLRTKQTGGDTELSAVILRLNKTMDQLHQLSTKTEVMGVEIDSLSGRAQRCAEELQVLWSVAEAAVMEVKEKNQELELRVSDSEKHLENLDIKRSGDDTKLSAVIIRMNQTMEHLGQLTIQNQVMGVELNSLSDRMRAAENHSEELQVLLFTVKDAAMELQEKNQELEIKVSDGEKHLEKLKIKQTGGDIQLLAVILRQNQTMEQLQQLNLQNQVMGLELNSLLGRVTTAQRCSEELQVLRSATEAEVIKLQEKNQELQWRLNITEQHLKTNMEGLQRRAASVSDLQKTITVLETRLQDSEHLMMSQLQTYHAALSFRLNKSENQLQELFNRSSGDLKVAFSAALTDSGLVGPFDQESTLIFSKTISDVGGAYDPTEGVFTAPVRGVYFFSFTVVDFLEGYMGFHLYLNQQPLLFNLNLNDHGGYASSCSGLALQLEQGDRVRLSLPATYRLYDDNRNFSVFSGFLAFPL